MRLLFSLLEPHHSASRMGAFDPIRTTASNRLADRHDFRISPAMFKVHAILHVRLPSWGSAWRRLCRPGRRLSGSDSRTGNEVTFRGLNTPLG
jgi:hypothetical protein